MASEWGTSMAEWMQRESRTMKKPCVRVSWRITTLSVQLIRVVKAPHPDAASLKHLGVKTQHRVYILPALCPPTPVRQQLTLA